MYKRVGRFRRMRRWFANTKHITLIRILLLFVVICLLFIGVFVIFIDSDNKSAQTATIDSIGGKGSITNRRVIMNSDVSIYFSDDNCNMTLQRIGYSVSSDLSSFFGSDVFCVVGKFSTLSSHGISCRAFTLMNDNINDMAMYVRINGQWINVVDSVLQIGQEYDFVLISNNGDYRNHKFSILIYGDLGKILSLDVMNE